MTFKELREIATEYDIEVKLSRASGYRDGGWCSWDTIWLYPTKKPWIRELSFWHELGHIMLCRTGGIVTGHLSLVSCEGAAWEIGLRYAALHKRRWKYDSKELKWAREQLVSYIGSEGDDLAT